MAFEVIMDVFLTPWGIIFFPFVNIHPFTSFIIENGMNVVAFLCLIITPPPSKLRAGGTCIIFFGEIFLWLLTIVALLAGALIVSTPQDVALMDARRGVKMFSKVQVPV